MIRFLIAGAAAVMCSSAVFADGERWEFRVSNALSPAQPTATVELWAHFDPRDLAFASAQLDVVASEPRWLDQQVTLPLSRPGTITGAAIEDIELAQWHEGLHPAIMDNPIHLFEATFSVDDFTPRTIDIETVTRHFAVYLEFTSSRSESRLATLTEGRGSLVVVPAPGATLLLAAAGLIVSRRKRP